VAGARHGQAAKASGRPTPRRPGTTNDYSNGLVHRLHTAARDGRLGRLRQAAKLGKVETGSRVAVPIWVSYMGRVLGDSPKEDFPVPDRVVSVADRRGSVGRVPAPGPDGVRSKDESGVVCSGVGQPRAQVSPASRRRAQPPAAGTPPGHASLAGPNRFRKGQNALAARRAGYRPATCGHVRVEELTEHRRQLGNGTGSAPSSPAPDRDGARRRFTALGVPRRLTSTVTQYGVPDLRPAGDRGARWPRCRR